MSIVLLAAAIWPFVLLALGLLLGRALRHGDRLPEHGPAVAARPARIPRRLGSDQPRRATLPGGSHALTGP